MKTYDHILLGTGQATGTLLGKFISDGASIAVIEDSKVGGSCVNFGCTPTKTLVASARAIHQAGRGDFFGFTTGDIQVNYARVRERMNEVRNNSREGLVEWMHSADKVELIRGRGVFTGPKTIRVGDREISAKNIFINTGTRANVPPIDGIEGVPALDSGALLDLETLPEHLVIIGGGYIGIEFAQIYRRFGSAVTILQREEQLMPGEDRDVAEAIREFLEAEGVKVYLEAETQSVDQLGKHLQFNVQHGDRPITINASHLLIATGRKPNSKNMGLETAGITTDKKGFITVDDYGRTSVDGVYALGDVNGRGAFTHTSVNDAEIVLDHLRGGERKISDRIPVYALFSDPPLGRVGLTEKAALASGKRVLRSVKPMKEISRAKEMGETRGFAKLLVDAETDLIIGAAILGPGGDEIINMFAAIMHSQIPCHEYRKVVLIHPTVSELMPFVLDGLEEVTS
jgi:pyruvate/2-oxoglutarate dehydrogenase complex dihydrolipoamide dehydrogenase (E3) component